MKSVIVNGVRCTLESEKKLCLEVPTGMTGEKLKAWSEANRGNALALLSDSDDSDGAGNDEPELYGQGRALQM